MRTHAQSVANDSRKPTNTSYTVRAPQNDSKKADLPARSSKPRTEEPQIRESRGCIGRTRAQRSDRQEIDCKNSKGRQHNPEQGKTAPTHLLAHRAGADGLGNDTNASTTCTDVQSVSANAKTAETASRNISIHQKRSMTQNSLIGLETETAKRPGRWKQVSGERNNVYVPRNAPIEAPGTRNREIV